MREESVEFAKNLNEFYTPDMTNKYLLKEYLNIDNNKSLNKMNIREVLNNTIRSGYLNETVVKSSFVERFCFTKSSKKNITMFELKANSSRADLCTINGSSTVYEIKTEYDTFFRLKNQLIDYQQLFDYVYVIVPEKNIGKITAFISKEIGIISYKKNRLGKIWFKTNRFADLNTEIDAYIQLSQLSIQALRKLNSNSESYSKEELINKIIKSNDRNSINDIYKMYYKNKYRSNWNYIYENKNSIHFLDYQWFFKNNIPIKIVYK